MKKLIGLVLILCVFSACELNEWSISGKVTCDGDPVAGVYLSKCDFGPTVSDPVTDRRGEYTLVLFANETSPRCLEPVKEGYYFEPKTQEVTLTRMEKQATGIDFEAIPVHVISGRLTYQGRGIAEALVTLSGDDDVFTRTDATGAYEFGLDHMGTFVVSTETDGYGMIPQEQTVTITAANRDAFGIDFEAPPGHGVSGTVTFEGVRMEGIMLTLSSDIPAVAKTDENGVYRFYNAPDGACTIQGAGSLTTSPVRALLNLDGDVDGVDFEMMQNIWVGDYILTDHNESLGDLMGYTRVTGYVSVYLADREDLWEMSSVTRISGTLKIMYDLELASLKGLENLTSVGGLNISAQPVLGDLSQIGQITQVDNDYSIQTIENLRNFDFLENLTSVGGKLSLRQLDNLTSLEFLGEHLVSLGSLELQILPNLESLKGFERITTLDKGLYLFDLDKITSLEGLHNLTTINEFLWIINLSSLENFTGLSSMNSFDGELIVQGDTSLVDLEGLEFIINLEKGLTFWGNENLLSLHGLENLKTVSSLSFWSNPVLKSIDALSGLEHIYGGILFSDNYELQSLSPLQFLTEINGSLSLVRNWCLTDYDGLQNVTRINGCLHIEGSWDLTDLDELQNLTYIGSYLKIAVSPSIVRIDGLNNVAYIGDQIIIRENEALCENYAWDLVEEIGEENIEGSITIEGNKDCL